MNGATGAAYVFCGVPRLKGQERDKQEQGKMSKWSGWYTGRGALWVPRVPLVDRQGQEEYVAGS